MPTANQNPEQLVRDNIDKMLLASGWQVQSKKQINLTAGVGVAVREYQTNVGPADPDRTSSQPFSKGEGQEDLIFYT